MRPTSDLPAGVGLILNNIYLEKVITMFKIKFADVLIITVVALLICTGSALAQTASVTITPASVDTKVKAGVSYTKNFTIVNNSNEPLRFRASSEDVWIDENNARKEGRPGTLPRSASLWIQFTPSEIVVEPHATAVLKALITVPQSATGSFYTVPVFDVTPASKPFVTNAALTSIASASIGVRFRTLVMLTTETGAEYNVEIMGANITAPTSASELELNLDLRNRGNAHAKVRGAFAILDAAGQLAGRGTIEEKRFLPTQQKPLKGTWAGELQPGSYTCLVTLSYNRIGMEPTSLVKEVSFKVK